MIRMIFVFLVIFALVYVGLRAFTALNRKRKWKLVKMLTYSFICASITTAVLTLIVILF